MESAVRLYGCAERKALPARSMTGIPTPDAPQFAVGDFVRRRLRKSCVGQVVAIVFGAGSIAYRVRSEDDCDEYEGYELEAAQEPSEHDSMAGSEE